MRQAWQRISANNADAAALRTALYIFPHAGGSRFSYAVLAKKLHGFCDVFSVEYPNLDIPVLAQLLAQALSEHHYDSTFFFGHSMGSLVAYETLLRLQFGLPQKLIVSACAAPQELHGPLAFQRYYGEWGEADLLQFMQSYGVLPRIFEHKEAREYFFALLAKDLRILKKYRASKEIISRPIHAIFGDLDQVVTKEKMLTWSTYSQKSFTLESIAGGHLYPMEQADLLAVKLKALMSTLE